MIRKCSAILTLCLAFAVAGCRSDNATQPPVNSQPPAVEKDISMSSPAPQPSQTVAPASTAVAKPKLDACALLTSQEIEAVQREAVKETKLTGQNSGGFNVSQCFFTLPTFTNSISLMVAHKGEGTDAREPRDFWSSTFHDTTKKKKDAGPAQKISGLGDEAFWMGNQVAGAIYVLKDDAYLRLSIGGPANEASKKRLRTLAQKAIARL
jgi:hypothetical protein